MKTQTFEIPKPQLTDPKVVSAVTFDPWPFVEKSLQVNSRIIDPEGSLRVSGKTVYTLGTDFGWTVLVTLEDGQIAVAKPTHLEAYLENTGQA